MKKKTRKKNENSNRYLLVLIVRQFLFLSEGLIVAGSAFSSDFPLAFTCVTAGLGALAAPENGRVLAFGAKFTREEGY